MKYMGWSYAELLDCPDELVDVIVSEITASHGGL